MWRGRSDGDDDNKAPGDDPRSRQTGKKIRRIESGSSNAGQAQAARRREAGTSPSLAARSAGRPSEQTDIGRPPSGPPGQGRPTGGRPPTDQSGRAPSLPPLNQPTGEVPQVPNNISAAAGQAGQYLPPTGAGLASADLAGADMGPAEDTVFVSGVADGGVFAQQTGERHPGFDAPMPSALPPMDEPIDQPVDSTGVMPGSFTDIDLTDSGPQVGAIPGDLAPTDPFPEAPTAYPDSGPVAPLAPETRSFENQPMAAAGAVGGVGAMGAPADARSASGRMAPPSESADRLSAQQRRGGGAAGAGAMASPRPKRGDTAANRLQDTEFKLADKRRKPKPKEPNKLVLGLAAASVILVGVAVAFLLTRGDGDEVDQVAAENTETEDVPEAAALDDAEVPAGEAAPPEAQVDEPTLVFEAAQTGPLQQGETYSIDLLGEPDGAMLQVVVDGLPQGQPATQLPDLILPAGRHSLYIQITNGPEQSISTPAEVYVIGDPPPAGYRANLSSVDMQSEGWVEAIRRFDQFREAGHEGLQLAPISPGFWNIFVGGLGEDSAAALSYCESFGLTVPEQCFAALTDPSAAGASPATTVADSVEDTTATTAEAMEDSTTVTTAAGG